MIITSPSFFLLKAYWTIGKLFREKCKLLMELDSGHVRRHVLLLHLLLQLCPLKSGEFQRAQKDHSPRRFSIRAASVTRVSLECSAIVHSVAGDMSIQPWIWSTRCQVTFSRPWDFNRLWSEVLDIMFLPGWNIRLVCKSGVYKWHLDRVFI